MRDDFPQSVKEQLAKRVGYRCSNPQCRQQTSGPQSEQMGAINIGVASHITAAARQGPRYADALTSEDRRSPENGIWLCQVCAKLVDSDVAAYPEATLREWKQLAEATALLELKGLRVVPDKRGLLRKLEAELPDLFAEMRSDLKDNPFIREFILKGKGWGYNADPNNPVLAYYFENHPHLRQKVRVLENHGLVQDITFNNVDRFQMSEELAEYLKSDERPL
jgi:hypothetical protein